MIKFRAWDIKDKQMCEVREINFSIESIVLVPPKNCTDLYDPILFKGEYVLMQSTGLTDKNGKEIFEGDVVKAIHYMTEILGVVYWSYGSFYVNGFQFKELNNLEVIGNIHEHSHLLG